jgi:hypothetical protein
MKVPGAGAGLLCTAGFPVTSVLFSLEQMIGVVGAFEKELAPAGWPEKPVSFNDRRFCIYAVQYVLRFVNICLDMLPTFSDSIIAALSPSRIFLHSESVHKLILFPASVALPLILSCITGC